MRRWNNRNNILNLQPEKFKAVIKTVTAGIPTSSHGIFLHSIAFPQRHVTNRVRFETNTPAAPLKIVLLET